MSYGYVGWPASPKHLLLGARERSLGLARTMVWAVYP
jgi:hypothetical protein